jgi:hypothetical protein
MQVSWTKPHRLYEWRREGVFRCSDKNGRTPVVQRATSEEGYSRPDLC